MAPTVFMSGYTVFMSQSWVTCKSTRRSYQFLFLLAGHSLLLVLCVSVSHLYWNSSFYQNTEEYTFSFLANIAFRIQIHVFETPSNNERTVGKLTNTLHNPKPPQRTMAAGSCQMRPFATTGLGFAILGIFTKC